MNVPTFFTFFRIVLLPIMVVAYYLPSQHRYVMAALIFSVACFTDWLDGYLARSLKQESAFGAFLDPVADKLAVAIALVLVVGDKHIEYVNIPAMIIIGREIAISALREWMSINGKRASVAVTYMGKIKTFVQMLSLVLLLAYNPSGYTIVGNIGCILLFLAAFLTLCSMFVYLKMAWKVQNLEEQ